MKYALLIIGTDDGYAALTEQQTRAMYAEHDRFGAMLTKRGALIGGAELTTETMRTVRSRDGERVVTDGPFAESAEGIGGWYVVEADDVEQATEYAKQVPILPTDGVEVRRIK